MSQSRYLRRVIKRPAAAKTTAIPDADRREFARRVLKKFRIVFSSIRTHYRDVESKCGLSGSQLWALAEIEKTPGQSVSSLAAKLLVHQSTASNLIEGLETMGLISKKRTKEDQRVVRLSATAKGRQLLSRAPAPTVGVLLEALENLPLETLWGLSINMDDLAATMRGKDDAAAAKPLADL
jgi:DNA-binding MarR family transcriptional regulator